MTQAATATKTTKTPDINDIDPRRIFANLEDALAYYSTIQGYTGADSVHFIITGQAPDKLPDGTDNPDAGTIDPTPYENCDVYVVKQQSQRVDAKGNKYFTTDAVLVHPVPTLEALLADDKGRSMVEQLVQLGLTHKLVRPLRPKVDANKNPIPVNYAVAAQSLPLGIDAFAETSRAASSSALEAWNLFYLPISKQLKEKSTAFRMARINKTDCQTAIENAAFAAYHFAACEESNVFELFANVIIKHAAKKGLDASLIQTWLNTRHDQTYQPEELESAEGEPALDLDAFEIE